MKILHIQHPHNPEFGVGNEFLADMTLLGGRSVLGKDYVDLNKQCWMYNINCDARHHIWGRGFTIYNLLPDEDIDREYIVEKIKDKYFDYILYGSIHICADHLDLVTEVYPKNRIILLEGSDFNYIRTTHANKGIFFKREMINPNDAIPISFSIPEKLFFKEIHKKRKLATCIPYRPETYVFTNNESYHQDYRDSYFGITCPKNGVDCLRHLEIISNFCFPYFINLWKATDYIMTHYPKKIFAEYFNKIATGNGHDFLQDIGKYDINMDEHMEYTENVFEHAKKNLTCESMFNYLLNKVEMYKKYESISYQKLNEQKEKPPEPQIPLLKTPEPQTPEPQNPIPQTLVPQNPVPQTSVPQTLAPQNPKPQNPKPQNPKPQNPIFQKTVSKKNKIF